MSDSVDSVMKEGQHEDGGYIFYDTSSEGSENENDEVEVEATEELKSTEEVIHRRSAEELLDVPSSKLLREKQMPRADRIEFPKEFVQWNTKFASISDDILSGSYLRCFGGELMSPSSFYLNLTETWNHLEYFMKELQERMATLKDQAVYDSMTPNSFTLIPGQLVLAFYNKEWHRGIIIRKIPRTRRRLFLVKMIDYGTQRRVLIEHIKYMFEDYLTAFPVQAIQCRLKFSQDIPEDFEWSRAALERFRELLVQKTFGVTFHQRTTHFSKELKRNYSVWSVTVHVMDGCAESLCDPSIKLGQPIKHKGIDEHHGEFIKTVAEFDIS